MAKKKTWIEKLNATEGLPKIVRLEGEAAAKWGGGTMYIATPKEIDEVMKSVPNGKLITSNGIREILAKRHKTAITCPLTTGIFTWIAANAAEEMAAQGEKETTAWWRTLKAGGELNPKYPGGLERQKTMLENEGHRVVSKGKKMFVENFGNKLINSGN